MKDFMVFSYHSELHYQQQYSFRVGFSRIVQAHIFYKNIEITEFQILGSQQLCNEKNVTTDIDTSLNEFVLLNELSKMKIEKENLHPYKMFCLPICRNMVEIEIVLAYLTRKLIIY